MKSIVALPGGELEYAVLVALWDLANASAREIHERVGKPNRLVYTTTAKVLDRLYAKGLIYRTRVGRLFIYQPAVERGVVDKARAKSMLGQILGSEPKPAIATLVKAMEAIDPELLDELAKVVDAHRKSRRG